MSAERTGWLRLVATSEDAPAPEGQPPDELRDMPAAFQELVLRRRLEELEERLLRLHGALGQLRAMLH